jgi:hypothetical protein
MDWVKERDALIAQTVAFVQSVTGRKPDFATSPLQVVTAPIEYSGPIENPDSVEQPLALEPAQLHKLPDPSLQNRVFPQTDIRKEIQNRIAAFQAHQHRFHRDRDVYFKSVLAKARADTDNSDISQLASTTDVHRARDPGSAI